MNDGETRLAFAHPAERAEATAPAGLRDRISLRDYIREVEIGAFQAERGTLQRIKFNVAVEVAPLTGSAEDDVDRILSYDRVTEAIDAELGERRLNLLETLAARVAERILLEPQALRVFVRIEKIDRGPYALGVEIVREKAEKASASLQTAALQADGAKSLDGPRPRVVYLSNDVIAGDVFRVIDRLAVDDTPLIFCVGAVDGVAPTTDAATAQRRIDLLAMDQNAWVLAGRDERCVVTATRTELDWAMRNGQICVWAPSKIVLDAVDGPVAASTGGATLMAWFAEEMNALELVMFGGDAPDCALPVRLVDL